MPRNNTNCRPLIPLAPLASLLLVAAGCSKKEAAKTGEAATGSGSSAAAGSSAAGTGSVAGTPSPDAAPTAPTPTPDVPQEVDPTASDKVIAVELTDADLEELKLPGKRQHVIGWTDRYGTNAIVITLQSKPKNGGLLVATHAIREGDASWTVGRDYKELVEECEDFDLSIYAQVGAWSVTDLDADGHGEATFAWSAGCRSDVSPITHKVLLVEKDEKFVLRGQTIDATGGGGDYKADPVFEKANPAFLPHAEKVWKLTVKEPG